MIQANELRIGNHIQHKRLNFTGIVQHIIYDHINTIVNSANLSEWVGIPLTPEILEKCGFENRYGCTWFYNKLKFTYEKNELSQFVRFHYSGKVTYLQYLHQLQNLVYILIHQELTITP